MYVMLRKVDPVWYRCLFVSYLCPQGNWSPSSKRMLYLCPRGRWFPSSRRYFTNALHGADSLTRVTTDSCHPWHWRSLFPPQGSRLIFWLQGRWFPSSRCLSVSALKVLIPSSRCLFPRELSSSSRYLCLQWTSSLLETSLPLRSWFPYHSDNLPGSSSLITFTPTFPCWFEEVTHILIVYVGTLDPLCFAAMSLSS